jgi:hypothetical protein
MRSWKHQEIIICYLTWNHLVPLSMTKMKAPLEPTAQNSLKMEENFFDAPTFQVLTIGVPFCAFKLIFGALCLQIGAEQLSGFLVAFGWLILAWASIDLIMNMARVLFQMAGRNSPVEYCSIAQIGRVFRRPRLFLAFDTFISFSIICFMLWSGWIGRLSPAESYLWYAATTLNLIGISTVNMWLEFRRGL